MTQYEYRTEVVPLQAGEPKMNDAGQFESGLTTDFLCTMGRCGWRVVAVFPSVAPQGSPLDVGGGVKTMAVLFVVLERCLGSDTRKLNREAELPSVGFPRY